MKKMLILIAVAPLAMTAIAQTPKPQPIGDALMQHWTSNDVRGETTVIYSNIDEDLQTDPNQYYIPWSETGAPYGDDLHMITGGRISEFTFVYYDPPGDAALANVTVRFYENDELNSKFPGGSPAAALIGEFVLAELPGDGLRAVTHALAAPFDAPQHLWVEVDFSDSPQAGLVLYNPPTVGASNDLFYVNADSTYVLDYPYVANFGFAVATGEDEEPPCPGDLDGDNAVTLSDLATLLAYYGMTSGAEYENGDLNGDGAVNLNDLADMLARYGTVCE